MELSQKLKNSALQVAITKNIKVLYATTKDELFEDKSLALRSVSNRPDNVLKLVYRNGQITVSDINS